MLLTLSSPLATVFYYTFLSLLWILLIVCVGPILLLLTPVLIVLLCVLFKKLRENLDDSFNVLESDIVPIDNSPVSDEPFDYYVELHNEHSEWEEIPDVSIDEATLSKEVYGSVDVDDYHKEAFVN